MNNLLLTLAGVSGMTIAIVHGYIGEQKVLTPIDGVSPVIKRVISAVFHLSTLYWFVGGLMLIIAPIYLSSSQQNILTLTVLFLYATGSIGNFWATRGRHFGWLLLAITCLLILLSLNF